MHLVLQIFQMLEKTRSMQTTIMQTYFSELLLGNFVACQSKTQSEACQCKESRLLAAVNKDSS